MHRTPLWHSRALSTLLDREVFLAHDLGLGRGAKVVCVVSGGSIDLGRLKELL